MGSHLEHDLQEDLGAHSEIRPGGNQRCSPPSSMHPLPPTLTHLHMSSQLTLILPDLFFLRKKKIASSDLGSFLALTRNGRAASIAREGRTRHATISLPSSAPAFSTKSRTRLASCGGVQPTEITKHSGLKSAVQRHSDEAAECE